MLNRQNTMRSPLQPILVREILAKVQAHLIDIRMKSDSEYIWILHLNGHFSKFSMLYALTSKKASEITLYINLFVWQFGVLVILQCYDGREFKGILLLFLKKYNIKLINSRLQTPLTQGIVQQANAVVKDKIAKWQAINGIGNWVDSLIEICDAINNQTPKFLPSGVTSMQFLFLRKSESSTSRIVFTTEEERQVLQQISVEDIDSFCEEAEYKKGKKRKPESHTQVEDALEIIPNEERYEQEASDPENSLQLRYIRFPWLLLFILIYKLLLRNPLQNASKLSR